MNASRGEVKRRCMSTNFEILNVHKQGHKLIAVLPLSRVLGHDLGSALDEDFHRLVEEDCSAVVLDIRPVFVYPLAVVFGIILIIRTWSADE